VFIGSNFIPFFLDKHPDYAIVNIDKLTNSRSLENLREVSGHSCYNFVGETYNRGGQNELTNLEIAGRICSILDRETPLSRASGKCRSYCELISFVKDRAGLDRR
jgi:dTDP-D-glucose 4,6-dehydratase